MRDEAAERGERVPGSAAPQPRPRPRPAAPEPPAEPLSKRRLGRFFGGEQPERKHVPAPVSPGDFPGVPRATPAMAEPPPAVRPRPRPVAPARPRPSASSDGAD